MSVHFCSFPVRSEVFAVSLPEVENGGTHWFLPPSLPFFSFRVPPDAG